MTKSINDQVTILTPTSPIPVHPDTWMIERSVCSIAEHAGLKGCRHLIVCDGCVDDSPLREHYQKYLARLKEVELPTCVQIVEVNKVVGLAGVIAAGLDRVETPIVYYHEHDFEVIRPVDTGGILAELGQSYHVKFVRLNKRSNRPSRCDYLLRVDKKRNRVPMLRSPIFSLNPHFGRISAWRELFRHRLSPRFQGGTGRFEMRLFKEFKSDVQALGFNRAHQRWGTYIYGRLNDPRVVQHLDGRRTRRSESTL